MEVRKYTPEQEQLAPGKMMVGDPFFPFRMVPNFRDLKLQRSMKLGRNFLIPVAGYIADTWKMGAPD